LAIIDMGLKFDVFPPFLRGEELGSYRTQCGWAEAYLYASMPSFILIHPAVWPQYTNVIDRTDRQNNGPIA